MTNGQGLQFAIYPFSVAGTPQGLAVGPPDDEQRIRIALEDLGSSGQPLPTRSYLVHTGPGSEAGVLALAERYRRAGLLGHVTLGSMRRQGFDLRDWLDLVREVVASCGSAAASLQITNEPNLIFMEGADAGVVEALVAGVVTAKEEARRRDLRLPVGFGSVPEGPMALPGFWQALRRSGGRAFLESTDFVGHNFYVDVFEEPVPLSDIPGRVERILEDLRTRNLVAAGIGPAIPIRVTENGWPTGANPETGARRPDERQSAVLEHNVRTIHALRSALNISHYVLFGLRDADSSKEDLFHRFGILRSDYSAKPAYATFKQLIRELGSTPDTAVGRDRRAASVPGAVSR